jgi:hypothetical protein
MWSWLREADMSVEIEGVDIVLRNLTKVEAWFHQALHDAGEEIAHLLASYAKTHHLWQPKSGATDTSTIGQIVEETREYVLVAVSAGMDYDVFLELAREGRWSWLWPAVVACEAQMTEIVVKHFGRSPL